ncbi:MAG: prepilin peptidase [Patescibacteria group bacterium]
MNVAVGFFIFIFGLIVGSFLNVVVARRGTGLSLGGRSFCFSCGEILSARDLIPLVSFVLSRGRCRRCGSAISPVYPLVELGTALLFVFVFMRLHPATAQDIFLFMLWSLIGALFLSIVVYDIRHKIIPDGFVWTANGIAFLFLILRAAAHGLSSWDVLAGPLLAAPFAALWFFSRGRWMGLGDAKLALGIGWLLGLSGGFAAVLLSVWTGALFGILALMLRTLSFGGKKFTIRSEIPFAPFLVLGTFLVFFYGIDFYDIESWFTFFAS